MCENRRIPLSHNTIFSLFSVLKLKDRRTILTHIIIIVDYVESKKKKCNKFQAETKRMFKLTAARLFVTFAFAFRAFDSYANRLRPNPLAFAAIQSIRFDIFQLIIFIALVEGHQEYMILLPSAANQRQSENVENDPVTQSVIAH